MENGNIKGLELLNVGLYPARKHCKMTGRLRHNLMTGGGFTLIELLVVVLIIGILAAIAVPQYQKAVNKARISEWGNYVSTFYKGIDLWLLSNGGYPTQGTRFSGDGSGAGGFIASTLDIEMPCVKQEGNWCYTKYGRFHVACESTECYVDYSNSYEGYNGWMPAGSVIWTSRPASGNGIIKITKVPTDTSLRKLICQYWKNSFGENAFNATTTASCAEVGI